MTTLSEMYISRQRGLYSDLVTGWTAENRGSIPSRSKKFCLLRSSQTDSGKLLGPFFDGLSLRLKWPCFQTDYSLSSSADVRNEWNSTTLSLHVFWRAWKKLLPLPVKWKK